jgi:mRNA interferase HigB
VDVVGRDTLEDFKRRHADIRGALDAWLAEAEAAEWRGPEDVKARYRSASIISGGRVVFNIRGNHYRLDVKIAYQTQVLKIVRIGTHAEYDDWEF